MPNKGRYNYDLILRHSNELALSSRKLNKERYSAAKKSISFLGQVFDTIAAQPKSLFRNVRMMLLTRFINHLFAQVLLTERGLLLDAMNCSRSATEVTAFYWLICIDKAAAQEYDADRSPRPVEIRKRLEARGIDISELQDAYKHQSSVSHVGNKHDQIQMLWESEKKGALSVGGAQNAPLQKASLNAVVAAIVLFFRYDPDYIVQEREEA
tara:strand:+ start:383 stop:1015 length:633 start_codon:yes stop_codon:yes gene_type:complete